MDVHNGHAPVVCFAVQVTSGAKPQLVQPIGRKVCPVYHADRDTPLFSDWPKVYEPVNGDCKTCIVTCPSNLSLHVDKRHICYHLRGPISSRKLLCLSKDTFCGSPCPWSK